LSVSWQQSSSDHTAGKYLDYLTTPQLNVLFTSIPTQNIMKIINLSDNNLVEVSAQMLNKTACHLDDVNLSHTKLTPEHFNALSILVPSNKLEGN